ITQTWSYSSPSLHDALPITHKARRGLRKYAQVNIRGKRLTARVDLEDRFTTAHVGPIKHNATIETPRTQQRRVKDVGAVGRRDRSEEHTSELQSRENLVCRL